MGNCQCCTTLSKRARVARPAAVAEQQLVVATTIPSVDFQHYSSSLIGEEEYSRGVDNPLFQSSEAASFVDPPARQRPPPPPLPPRKIKPATPLPPTMDVRESMGEPPVEAPPASPRSVTDPERTKVDARPPASTPPVPSLTVVAAAAPPPVLTVVAAAAPPPAPVVAAAPPPAPGVAASLPLVLTAVAVPPLATLVAASPPLVLPVVGVSPPAPLVAAAAPPAQRQVTFNPNSPYSMRRYEGAVAPQVPAPSTTLPLVRTAKPKYRPTRTSSFYTYFDKEKRKRAIPCVREAANHFSRIGHAMLFVSFQDMGMELQNHEGKEYFSMWNNPYNPDLEFEWTPFGYSRPITVYCEVKCVDTARQARYNYDAVQVQCQTGKYKKAKQTHISQESLLFAGFVVKGKNTLEFACCLGHYHKKFEQLILARKMKTTYNYYSDF